MTAPPTLPTWTAELAAALGLAGPVPITELLELARDAAHGVQRPAAPVTTFLVGLAVGRGMEFAAACQVVQQCLAALPPPG